MIQFNELIVQRFTNPSISLLLFAVINGNSLPSILCWSCSRNVALPVQLRSRPEKTDSLHTLSWWTFPARLQRLWAYTPGWYHHGPASLEEECTQKIVNLVYLVKTHRTSVYKIYNKHQDIKISFFRSSKISRVLTWMLSIPDRLRHTHKLIFQHWSHKRMRLKSRTISVLLIKPTWPSLLISRNFYQYAQQNHFVEQILTDSILRIDSKKNDKSAICPLSIFVTGRLKKKFR